MLHYLRKQQGSVCGQSHENRLNFALNAILHINAHATSTIVSWLLHIVKQSQTTGKTWRGAVRHTIDQSQHEDSIRHCHRYKVPREVPLVPV